MLEWEAWPHLQQFWKGEKYFFSAVSGFHLGRQICPQARLPEGPAEY